MIEKLEQLGHHWDTNDGQELANKINELIEAVNKLESKKITPGDISLV